MGGLSEAGPVATGIAPLPLQVDIVDVGFDALFFLVGLYLVYRGFDEYRVSRLIVDTGTERVRSVAVGRTELTGHARAAGTVFHRPFTDGECLYARYTVREHDHGDDGSEWNTIHSDTWIAPFDLEDDTGAIRVEPDRATTFEISDANTTEITVEGGESPPPAVRAFLDGVDGVGPSHERRRYEQAVIPTDAAVYVLGGAEQRDAEGGANEDRLVIRRDDGSGRFVVSDMTEAELTATLSRRAPLLILLGLGLSVVCLYILLDMLGVA